MSIKTDFTNFPLISITLGPEQIDDVDMVKRELEHVFVLAQKHKTKISVIIHAGVCEGFGFIASAQLIKHLIDVRCKIKKYFNRCCITMDDNEGMFSYILSIYTPARPLKLFKSTQTMQALQWVTTVDG
jgi:hypothetical protein